MWQGLQAAVPSSCRHRGETDTLIKRADHCLRFSRAAKKEMAGRLSARWWGGSLRVCSVSSVMGQDPPPAPTPTCFQPSVQSSHAVRLEHPTEPGLLRSPHPRDEVRTRAAQGPSRQDACWSFCLAGLHSSASGSWPECPPSLQQGGGSSPSCGPVCVTWPCSCEQNWTDTRWCHRTGHPQVGGSPLTHPSAHLSIPHGQDGPDGVLMGRGWGQAGHGPCLH